MKKAFFILVLSIFLVGEVGAATVAYEEDFESYSTGDYPPEWKFYPDIKEGESTQFLSASVCTGSGCVKGDKKVWYSSSQSSKVLYCFEKEVADRHCYLPIDIPKDVDQANVSFDYKISALGDTSHARICVHKNYTKKCGGDTIVAVASPKNLGNGYKTTNVEGWSRVEDHNITEYAGKTVYLDMSMDGATFDHKFPFIGVVRRTVTGKAKIDNVKVEFNHAPEIGLSISSGNIGFIATYTDADGDNGSITIFNKSGVVEKCTNLSSGEECLYDWETCESHNYTVKASDGNLTTTTGGKLNTLCRPSVEVKPYEAYGVGLKPNVSALLTHPNKNSIEYSIDAGSGSIMGGKVSNNTRVDTVYPEVTDWGRRYYWGATGWIGRYVKKENDTWFVTSYKPIIENITLKDSPSTHELKVEANISDQDGVSDLDRCEVNVSDGEGNSAQLSTTLTRLSVYARCTGSIDYGPFDEHLDSVDFNVTVYDDQGASTSKVISEQFPNHIPEINDVEFTNYPDRNAFDVSFKADKGDDIDSRELRSCAVVVDDGERSYSIQNYDVRSHGAFYSGLACRARNIGPQRFPSVRPGEELKIILRATDKHGKVATKERFWNTPTGIRYRYSGIIMQPGDVRYIDYINTNDGSSSYDYKSTLKGVNATFVPGGSSVSYSLDPSLSTNYSIKVNPKDGLRGKHELRVVTENLDTGTVRNDSIPVIIRSNEGAAAGKKVPGPGLLHLMVLAAMAFTAFILRK